MRHLFSLLIVVLLFNSLSAQYSGFHFPKTALSQLSSQAIERIEKGESILPDHKSEPGLVSGVAQLRAKYQELQGLEQRILQSDSRMPSSDTLWVTDTLEITGSWFHEGAIIVALDGFLHFRNAQATILGDIFIFGSNARIQADSSTLNIPQAFFYQRVLFALSGGKISYRNTIVDHSGLSHNIILADSSSLELINVTNKGFTTNGIYGKSTVHIDGTNQAGEYIMMEQSKLEFHNANTVLLWHHFPEGSIADFSFPDADTVNAYRFNASTPGVSGIEFDVLIDHCADVMWGMMPENNTNIHISDSEIRAIGLWFMGSDSVTVSGLVDRSTYADFLAPLSDRTLRLTNCNVTTWSIYPMEKSHVDLSACIVGEVGTGGHSSLMGQQYFCDGSGGYVWASDSSMMINGFSYVSGYVRSQAHGTVILAYSSLSGGFPTAMQYSLLMVLQCTLPAEPRIYDYAAAWYAYIDQPFEVAADQTVAVTGSAWIDKMPGSTWMDFRKYQLFYQLAEANTWTEIPVDSLNEKRDEVLAYWNTAGLEPGQYILKLVLTDEWGNQADAIKAVQIQETYGLNESNRSELRIFPVPAKNKLTIELPEEVRDARVKVTDMSGKTLFTQDVESSGEKRILLPLSGLQPGCYLLNVINSGKQYFHKFIVY
jgi:hypothetical protein